jgi:hypothetical protein
MSRKRGAQLGNQNARKHGFYASSFTGTDKTLLAQAARMTGLDNEIALVRARLKAVLADSPDDLPLINETVSTLACLMRTNQKCGFNRTEHFEELRWNVLSRLGPQFGLDLDHVAAAFLGKPEALAQNLKPARDAKSDPNQSP